MNIVNLKKVNNGLILALFTIYLLVFNLNFKHNSILSSQFLSKDSINYKCLDDSVLINQLIDYEYYNVLDSAKLLDQNYYFKLLTETNNNIFYEDEYKKGDYYFKVLEGKINGIGKCYIAYYEFKNVIGSRQNRQYIIINIKLKNLYFMYLDNLVIKENYIELILINRNNSKTNTKVKFDNNRNKFIPLSCY